MKVTVKQYAYTKGTDPVTDADFAQAKEYGRVKAGTKGIFWKCGLHWYTLPMVNIQRIFRRREPVIRRLCCGGKSYYIEYLVMVLSNDRELVIHIGDDVPKDAEALLKTLQWQHPNLQYGKA